MNFRRRIQHEEPEINLIPLIDILLVILIFLAATTSFTRFQQLSITLPQASAQAIDPNPLRLAINKDGLFALDTNLIADTSMQGLTNALKLAVGSQTEPVLLINADAQATHENVVKAMEAARLAGIQRVNFATQQ
ncbi:MAG TPA: biopolymer transporter ExbD [Pusillimonas sp.]|jgi:biopolymer transport protein ExbD|nr:biopolymer transporter ExbD [Pusillimonas sp.]|tara:strand:- start:251985 stop:252389 length:405 start_codon:yes stop_codon:yes gene_type:complete